ncbi:LuxR family transcriptional regulator [Rhizocola hellebori]|uniref:LuxR family transcriptional regulator n=1 Tax=Rhizocola hellebori TaxID=1392758 RepID=A0A8J3Q3A3_9ACTN|nr:LuxR family transcriptional regulator [Rhizocola hellebori]
MIGREGHLAQLTSALDRAAAGSPTVVFVTGEAGVGKSRLVHDFSERSNTRVFTGCCPPLAEALLPYAPITQILRAIIAEVGADELRRVAGPHADRLAVIAPDLERAAPIPGTGLWQADQLRLQHSLLNVLERLATDPTVLVVEDLHWADASTRAIVDMLVRGLRNCRLLLVCTYRDDELPPEHPLHSLLVELVRVGADTVALTGLDAAGTATLMASILGTDPDPAMARHVFARTGGNPFLVEELVAAGGALPERLRDILLLRVRRLPPTAQRVMRAVAIAGPSAEHAVLEPVVGPSDDLEGGVKTAVDQHLLRTDGDRYTFRHALTAEAVIADTLPAERIRLHRALAASLESRLPAGRASIPNNSILAWAYAEVAYHWLGARDHVRALSATIEAGLAAQRSSALPEARQHFTRALTLWGKAPQAPADAALDLVDLYRHAAETSYLSGDVDEALALVRDGICAAEEQGDRRRGGLLHLLLGRYLSTGASAEQAAIAAVETAVEMVPDVPSLERAQVLAGLARHLQMNTRDREAMPWAQRALVIARSVGARHEECHALATYGVSLARLGELDAGIAHLRQALAIAEQLDSAFHIGGCHAALSDGLLSAGRFTEAAEVAMRGVHSSAQHGTERLFAGPLLGNAVEALFWSGRWETAIEKLPAGPHTDGHQVSGALMWHVAAAVHTAMGKYAEAELFLAACLRVTASGGHTELRGAIDCAMAELCAWRDEPAAAYDWAIRGLDSLGVAGHGLLLARLLAVGARAFADLTTRPGGTERPSAVNLTKTIDRLRDAAALAPGGVASLAVADAELARARGAGAAPVWIRAASLWARLDAPYQLAYARWRQAEALLAARGSRRSAARALQEADAIAKRLGAAPLRHEIGRLASRARLALAEGNGTAPSTVAAEQSEFGLTRREEEVLRQLGGGHTNRQIAEHLFISEKTVSIHVSRVLAKLGVPNRAAAAAAAHRLGLDSASGDRAAT